MKHSLRLRAFAERILARVAEPGRIRAEIIRSTQAQVQWELERAEQGSVLHQAAFLRFAVWRLACLRVFIDRGWRVPAALREVKAIAGDDGYRLPESILEKAVSAPKEAAFVARKELLFELLPRVFAEYGIGDVRGVELLGSVAPKLRAAFLALTPLASVKTVDRLRVQVQRLELSFRW